MSGNDQKRASSRLLRLDRLDRKIIGVLQAEGRKPYSKIAAEVGSSESVVRYRVQRLQEERVIDVVGVADPLRIGFDRMALVGIKTAPGKAHDVCFALKEIAETSYVVMIAGSFDVIVELICEDTDHFTNLLTKQVQTIEGVVATESFFVLEIHKMAYGWGVPDVALAADSDDDEAEDLRDADGSPSNNKESK